MRVLRLQARTLEYMEPKFMVPASIVAALVVVVVFFVVVGDGCVCCLLLTLSFNALS
jgi:hypothetical protein